MRNPKLNYIVVGVFTFGMFIAGIFSIIMLSGRTGDTDAYHLVLDNVADVKFGTQVRYEGYPIGEVERVVPYVDGNRMRFRIEVAIRNGWKIAKDSIARVGSSSLLSAKTIDIARGKSAAAEPLAPGDMIASAPPVDVFSIVSDLAEEFGDLSRDGLNPLIKNVGTMANELGHSFHADLKRLMASLNATASAVEKRAETVAGRMDSISAELDESSKNLGRVLTKENADAARRAVANIERTTETFAATSRKLELTRQQVDQLIRNVDNIVQANGESVDKSLTNLQYTLQSIARTVDSVMFNIDSSGRNMSEFTRMIRENPSLLLGDSRRDQISPAASADGRFAR
jgi:phospholipid/cholesterol/gamma-HCH transport system substrate-binding protein